MLTADTLRSAIQATDKSNEDLSVGREDCLEIATRYLNDNGYTEDDIAEKEDNSCLALFVYDVICYTKGLEEGLEEK
jgi:hypothetical protein